jgi:hypothetical protein
MVLCDAVHRDLGTGKFTLLGTFSTLHALAFPASVAFSVYFAITDGQGKTTISLRLVDSESIGDPSAQPLRELPTEFEFASPLMILESVAFIGAQVPRPGLYHCELYAGQELLMSRRLLVVNVNEESFDE